MKTLDAIFTLAILMIVALLVIVGISHKTRHYYSESEIDEEINRGHGQYWIVKPSDPPNRVMLLIDANDIRFLCERRKP